MALVKLSTLEEAINGAALLHGKEVYGRKLNVSFTKSKFWKWMIVNIKWYSQLFKWVA